ncbi:MAG: cache domain-containing protein [Anaerolineales bacterium]
MKNKLETKFLSLRARLILLLVLAILPIVGLNYYLIQRHSAEIRQQAGQEQMNVVKLFANQQNQNLISAKQLLKTIVQVEEIYSKRAENCQNILKIFLSTNPSFSNLGIADLNGDVYCSAVQQPGKINIADRDYFQQAIASRDFAYSKFQIGRITGKPGIAIGYPVIHDNQISAVAFVALNLNGISQEYSRLNLPQGSTVTIVDPHGIVLVRLPEGDKWVGKQAPENSIVTYVIGSTQIGVQEAAGVDGIKRLYAYTSLEENGKPIAYLFVGVPTRQIYEQATREMKMLFFGSFIIALIAFVGAWRGGEYLLSKRIYALIGVVKHFQDGDFNARAKVDGINDEINQLATSFNHMMNTIQSDIALLKQSEERFHDLVENIPIVVYEAATDRRGTTLFVNSRIKDLLGFSAEEWLSEPELWFRQIYEEDRENVLASNQITYRTGESFRMTYRL